jgi:U4/U6 small nuclear ribonucleoprotein PRP4
MEMAKGRSGMDYPMDDSDSDDSDDEGEFFTEGTDDLLAARRKLAAYSLQRLVLSCNSSWILMLNW